MSEKIDYERYLPELKNTEFYVVKSNGGGGLQFLCLLEK